MSKNRDWIRKSLMGSTTMPAGTGGAAGFSFLPLAGGHVHSSDGSCCGHDHHHDHDHGHHHGHDHGACGLDHEHGPDCGHGVPKAKG